MKVLSSFILACFVLAVGLWTFIVWSSFTREAYRNKTVNHIAVKKTAIKIGLSSMVTGFLLWIVGFVVSSSSPQSIWDGYSKGVLISLVGCVGFFAFIGTVGFLLKAFWLKRLFDHQG